MVWICEDVKGGMWRRSNEERKCIRWDGCLGWTEGVRGRIRKIRRVTGWRVGENRAWGRQKGDI